MLNCCFCCDAPAALGCVTGCEILLDVIAEEAGVYTLKSDFKGHEVAATMTAEIGEALSFDLSGWNEIYKYTAKVFAPSGAEVAVGGAACFTFSRRPTAPSIIIF